MLGCSFYLAVRKQAEKHLVDGTGHRPHYSLRTLCRALKYVISNPCKSVQRSLYEVGVLVSVDSLSCTEKLGFWIWVVTVCSHIWEYLSFLFRWLQGFCMSFLTQVDRSSHPVVQKLVCQHILMGNTKCLKQVGLASGSRVVSHSLLPPSQ